MRRNVLFLCLLPLVAACATPAPEVPYPAFVVVDELADTFVATLPGVRAKSLTGDLQSRQQALRIDAPADWSFSSGGSPTQDVEIFVLQGALRVGEFELGSGGYAYIPGGFSGTALETTVGARFLYFVDDAAADATIETPIIANASLLPWQGEGNGVADKVLREDPGSGARSWLRQVTSSAPVGWTQDSVTVEGYLLEGATTGSECVGGEAVIAEYLPGGFFRRPAGAAHGGASSVTGTAVWFMRRQDAGIELPASCP